MAEGKCFHLEVVTPDRQFYIGDADSLVLPAIDGYMGVEAGHEPVVTAVVPGELKYRSQDECHAGPKTGADEKGDLTQGRRCRHRNF